jgi:uncharacterized protein
MVETSEIEALAQRIAEAVRPERIVLFGSYAKGEPTSDSDVDILVIVPFEGKSWKAAADIRKVARSPFPMDLIARTPRQVRERLDQGDSFLSEILSTGVTLYEA